MQFRGHSPWRGIGVFAGEELEALPPTPRVRLGFLSLILAPAIAEGSDALRLAFAGR